MNDNDIKKKFLNTRQLVILALIFAIMIASLTVLPLNAVVPLVALIVIAEIGGIKLAGIGGLMFGLASLLSAAFMPSTPLYVVFLNPLVSVAPRIIAGLAIYLVYKSVFKLLKGKIDVTDIEEVYYKLQGAERAKAKRIDYISMSAGAITGAIVNTVLVLGTIFLIYNNNTYTLNDVSILVRPEVILPLVAASAIMEPILCAIIAPPIVTALRYVR